MRDVEVIKEARKEILTKLVKLMELKKEIIQITLVDKAIHRTQHDKAVLGYLDNAIGKMQGQVDAIKFMLNEDSEISDFANEPFYDSRYGINEEHVSGDYIEDLRRAKTEKDMIEKMDEFVRSIGGIVI